MFHVVLFEPEIPANSGNIIRLCANTGCALHLIRPLGFQLDDKSVRRAGLDYHELADVQVHDTLGDFLRANEDKRLFAVETSGSSNYSDAAFSPGDALLFGPETRGLPPAALQAVAPERRMKVPMRAGNRSLNLSNTVALVVYEAWRQNKFGQ